jgi:hypothetical protein
MRNFVESPMRIHNIIHIKLNVRNVPQYIVSPIEHDYDYEYE